MNLQNSLGRLLGLECHAKGAYILLGPMLNIQHGQLGGLGFKDLVSPTPSRQIKSPIRILVRVRQVLELVTQTAESEMPESALEFSPNAPCLSTRILQIDSRPTKPK